MSIKDKLTIVIPCKNEEAYIGNLLDDLAEQNGMSRVKVVIAEAGSTDHTNDVLSEKLQAHVPKLIGLTVGGGTVAYGRNNGAEFADTPYILFIDADVRLFDKNTILKAIDAMDGGCKILTCKVKSYASSLRSKIAFFFYNLVVKVLKFKWPIAIGAFMMVDREEFLKRGKFNEEINNSSDFHFSKTFSTSDFCILDCYIGQDDRRFKKMGYFGKFKHTLLNFWHRNNIEHFKQDTGYWN